jgi:hypothetical protein
MKKWQKIIGIIALVVLAILNIIICVSYLEYAASIYFEPGGNTQDAIEIIQTDSQYAIKKLSYLVYANYIIALFLFICLWRKGGKR